MDQLIFYKDGSSLQDKISQIRFSYQRPFTRIYINRKEKLQSTLANLGEGLFFFFSDQLSANERLLIQQIKNQFPALKIVLCSNIKFSLDAWKLRVFDFIDQPIDNQKLIQSYKHYITVENENSELVIKHKDGIRKVPFKYINYLKAAGNYTSINLIRDKKILQTKQLQHFDYVTEQSNQLERIHRSIILNKRNIKALGNKEIIFYQTQNSLQVSAALEAKLKRSLLGK